MQVHPAAAGDLPTCAYWGMAAVHWPLCVAPPPTDLLPMSWPGHPTLCSRNALLAPEDRQRCVCISRALTQAREQACACTTTDAAQLQQQIVDQIAAGGGLEDYVEVVDAHTLRPLAGDVRGRHVLIAVAARFGNVRLIDNVEFG